MKDSPTSFNEGLFEPWINPSERKQTIGDRPDVGAILSLTGDAKRGASWFADVSGAQCRACHRKNGVGVAIGPDLDGIGRKRERGQVLRSMLFPSEMIEPEYRTKTLLLDSGAAVSGLIVRESESSLTMKTSDGLVREIATNSIEAERENTQSMMPEGQLASLTPQQVADLLAYLTE